MSVDLDDTTHCPVAGHCAVCQATADLQVRTAYMIGAVGCATLCGSCTPLHLTGQALVRTRGHCAHLGITEEQMSAELVGVSAPGCLWCGLRPAPYAVHGDPVCVRCYRDHRAEVAS